MHGSGVIVLIAMILVAAGGINIARRYARSADDRRVLRDIVSDRQAMVPAIIVVVVSLTLSIVDNGLTWALLADLVMAAAVGLLVAAVVHYGLDRRRRRHAG